MANDHEHCQVDRCLHLATVRCLQCGAGYCRPHWFRGGLARTHRVMHAVEGHARVAEVVAADRRAGEVA